MSDNLSLKEKLEAEGGELSDETILLIDEIKNHDLKCHRSTRFYIGDFIFSEQREILIFHQSSIYSTLHGGIWGNIFTSLPLEGTWCLNPLILCKYKMDPS